MELTDTHHYVCVCIYVCVCVYIYVCVCIYVCVYTYKVHKQQGLTA